MWTFKCYVDDHGSDSIRVWYDAQDEAVQAEMDATIELLRVTPRQWWRRPRYRNLTRAGKGLGELRIIAEDHYRIFGFFGPNEEAEFCLLLSFNKDDDPHYAASIPEAFERRDMVLYFEDRSDECSFP